jgi:hypothetical protein
MEVLTFIETFKNPIIKIFNLIKPRMAIASQQFFLVQNNYLVSSGFENSPG